MLDAVKQEVRMEGFGLKRPLQGEIRRIETFQTMDSLWDHRADYNLLGKPLKVTRRLRSSDSAGSIDSYKNIWSN